MSSDNGAVSFDFLRSSWIITSHPTFHALSGGIISGALSRYQTVRTEAVPVASLPWPGHAQKRALGRQTTGVGHPQPKGCSRLQAVCLVTWTKISQSEVGLSCRVLWGTKWHSNITGQWLLNSRNVVQYPASLVPQFLLLRANWKSSILFLLFTCPFVILTSQHCISQTVPQCTLVPQ